MASILEELLKQAQGQPEAPVPQIDSTGQTLGNILALGANIAGAATGRGQLGQPFSQFAAQSGQRATQEAALQQRAQTEQRLKKQQVIDLAKSIGTEGRATAREERAAKKDARMERRRMQAQEFQGMLKEGGDLAGSFDPETRQILQMIAPEKAVDAALALQKGKVANKLQKQAAAQALQFKTNLDMLKKDLDETKLSKFQKAQQQLNENPDLKPAVALANQGFTTQQIENILDTEDLATSLGVEDKSFIDFLIGAGPSTAPTTRANEVQAAQQQRQGAQQAIQNQVQFNPDLYPEIVQILQAAGAPITPQNIQTVLKNQQRRQ